MDDAVTIPPAARLQRFQRFGDNGPAYEILGPGAAPNTVRIHVLESLEELDYPVAHAKDDPAA